MAALPHTAFILFESAHTDDVTEAEVSIGDAAFTFPFHCHSSMCSTQTS